MKWDSALYDSKHDFVAEYGKDLLEFVPQNDSQTILDLGCGTGTLTAQLASKCRRLIGLDSSQDMIEKARNKYGHIDFRVGDALDLPFEREIDLVFSNAVFHWIHDHDKLLQSIYKALKPGGILVCEFGAEGNIATIEKAFQIACNNLGYEYKSKFNFPSVKIFKEKLERNGFIIDRIYDYDRPTLLKDGEMGLANWMKQFFASELAGMPKQDSDAVLETVMKLTRERLWNGEGWMADYRRLRAIAHI